MRRRPIWRAFWCLLLGGLVGWLVAWGLEPRPRWTLPVSAEHTLMVPVSGDPQGHYVAAWEMDIGTPGTGGTRKRALRYAVLDASNGSVLHSVDYVPNEFDEGETYPRFCGQQLWRMTGISTRQLHCWNFSQNTAEKVVHTWQSSSFTVVAVSYSEVVNQSRRCLLRLWIPVPFIHLLKATSMWGYLMWPIHGSGEFDLSWYETWELPGVESKPARMLSRWTPHWSRWGQHAALSPDGKWAAFPDCLRNPSRRLIDPEKAYQGDELLNLLRSAPYGCLLYDAASGKLHDRYDCPEGIATRVFWNDDLLLYEASTSPSLDNFRQSLLKGESVLAMLGPTAFGAIQVLPASWRRIAVPPLPNVYRLESNRGTILAVSGGIEDKHLTTLQYADGQLSHSGIRLVTSSLESDDMTVLTRDKQVVVELRPEPLFPALSGWLEKQSWYKSWFPKWGDDLGAR